MSSFAYDLELMYPNIVNEVCWVYPGLRSWARFEITHKNGTHFYNVADLRFYGRRNVILIIYTTCLTILDIKQVNPEPFFGDAYALL
jgi:hypothetical protein